ncbi:hypothetical protein HOY80DRAFT_985976 [Tuber brumale]|nr:hypothetical protein HOY80DRAFT_985976 [Tuber brumale]
MNPSSLYQPHFNQRAVESNPLTGMRENMYISDKDFLPSAALIRFFEQYTTLRGDQITQHILKIRSKAWELENYPCIGNFYFLEFTFINQPIYPDVLRRLKQGAGLLDVGCCFGQAIRKLVVDGAPAANLYGIDLRTEFIELGYELFLDRGRLSAHFMAPVDVLLLGEGGATSHETVRRLAGKMDIIHLGQFLHLFNWQEQVRAATNIAGLLSPAKGSLIVGHQVGSVITGEFPLPWVDDKVHTVFVHDESSFKELWKQVPGEWEVEFEFVSMPRSLGKDSMDRLLANSPRKLFMFTIRRA